MLYIRIFPKLLSKLYFFIKKKKIAHSPFTDAGAHRKGYHSPVTEMRGSGFELAQPLPERDDYLGRRFMQS